MLARAEEQYFKGRTVKDELREYQEERKREARVHLISYIAVNLGLIGINILPSIGKTMPHLVSLYPMAQAT